MRRLTIAIVLLVGAAWACGESLFGCVSDEQCARGDVGGVCQATGYCSFPDDTCASGQRYGEHASKGLAGACVEEREDDDAAGASGGGMTSEASESADTSEAETSGDPPVTTTSTTTDGDETSTTGSSDTSEGEEETAERTTGSVEPCSYEEHFEGRTVPSDWTVGSGALEVVVADGVFGMELMSSETAEYGWAWTEPMNLNDRTVIAEIGSPPPLDSNGQLMLELTTGTLSFFMVAEGPHLFARTDDGNGHTTHATMAFDPVDTRFVSIGHMPGVVRFAYSDDGVTWTTLHDLPIDISFSSTNLSVVGGTWKYESNVGFVGFDSISVCP